MEELVSEIIEEEELNELTTTGDVEGYNTPMAFTGDDEEGKKKKKKISTNSTGYNVVKEALESKDIEVIKKLIRSVIADVYRDIWIKRSTWKQENIMPGSGNKDYKADPNNPNKSIPVGLIDWEGHDTRYKNLPTADPGIAGALWSNSGVLTVSAG